MAHTGRNRPGGALSHLIPVDPWSVSHTIERIVARTQRLDRKPHPNSTYDAHTVPEAIAHERPPRRHLGPMLLSSRRTRGGLRHIQKLFAAGGVEDDDVLGGRAPRPPPPAAGGTLRPAPTRRPEVGSEGAGRIVPRAARPRRRTRPIDRARRIPPCEARIEGACKAKERCLTRSTLPSGKISWASCSRTGCKRAHGGRALVSDALRVQCDDYMEAMQHYLNIRSPGVSTRS